MNVFVMLDDGRGFVLHFWILRWGILFSRYRRYLSSLKDYFTIFNPDWPLGIHEFAMICMPQWSVKKYMLEVTLLSYFWWQNGREDRPEGNFVRTFSLSSFYCLYLKKCILKWRKNIDTSFEYQKGINLSILI